MALTVYLYGQLREMTGTRELVLEGITDTDQLIREMNIRFPGLKEMPCLLAVDRHIIHSNTVLREDQELALLPPYSGG
jgi:molybdopterin converting factor small subunit